MVTKKILTIGGSDILSGGGIQADLATYANYNLYAFMALTSIVTVMEDNFFVNPVDTPIFKDQLDNLENIEVSAIKIGLLPNKQILDLTADFLKNKNAPIILDPVIVFKENNDYEVSEIRDLFIEKLLPQATVITPNLIEAEILSNHKIKNMSDMKEVAKILYSFGPKNIVIKGGNRLEQDKAIDLFYDGEEFKILEKVILRKNNYGAGCTFASSIASNLAKGVDVYDSVRNAKEFVFQAIKNSNEYGVVQNYEC